MKRKEIGILMTVMMVFTMIPSFSFSAELPFSDVPENKWYYSDVKNAYETGLINGFEDRTFRPEENMTYAQAVKLAACMNQKYTTGSVTLSNGSPQWFDSYVAYAREKGIIDKDYDWNSKVTRAGCVEIFADSLPDEALREKNHIVDGCIPDVGKTHPQAAAIYKLYRAGILTGVDEIGSFQSDKRLERSEVSAILTRMMNEGARKDQSLGPADDDQDLNILLNRSDLEGLGEIDGMIYVTGHKSPDSDTVGSSIAYAALLQKLGYDAIPVVLGKINNETQFILDTAGVDTPELLEDASGKNMVLVDNSEYTQSANGIDFAHIISIIDHHGDGSVTTGNQLIYDARPLGATATIIWIRYRNYGVTLDTQTAFVMLGAILSDTKNLQSDATTFADREAVKSLSRQVGLSDVNEFYQEMYKASISYDGMTDEDIFFSDYKEYEASGTKFAIGCINAYDESGAREIAERMKKTIPSVLPSAGMDLAFAQISIFHDDISITYIVPSDQSASELLESAFKNQGEFDGTSYRFDSYMSRKQVLVPALMDALKTDSKE